MLSKVQMNGLPMGGDGAFTSSPSTLFLPPIGMRRIKMRMRMRD
jgi:hypothetical protein